MTLPEAVDKISEYAELKVIALPDVVTHCPLERYADVTEYAMINVLVKEINRRAN